MAIRDRRAGSPPRLRAEVWLVLALGAVVEAAASYPWYVLLHYIIDAQYTAAVGPGSLLLFAFAGALLGVGLERLRTSASLSRWVTGPGGVALAVGWLALTPPVWRGSLVVSAAALLWNWHRGLRLAWEEEDHGLALHRFTMAVARLAVALLVLLLYRGWGDRAHVLAVSLWSGPALLLAGLLLLAATHQIGIRRSLAASGSLNVDRSRFWSSAAVIATVLVLALALEGSRLLGSMPPALERAILAPIRWLLGRVLEGLFRILVAVLGPLTLGFLWLLRRVATTMINISNAVMEAAGPVPPLNPLPPQTRSLVVRGVGLLLLAFIAALLLARAARGRSRERELDEGLVEVHESLWDWDNLKPGSWLDALRSWLRGRSSDAGDATGAGREPNGPAWDLRRLYRRFLTLGEELGRGREPAETPRRYQQVFTAALSETLPPGSAAQAPGRPLTQEPASAQALTRAYEALRYGETEPDPAELAAIRQQLADLEATLADRPKQQQHET